MARATAARGNGAGKSIPALSNLGYFSEYYLAHRIDVGLKELYDRWDEAEKRGDSTARTRVRGLSAAVARHRADAARTAPDESADAAGGRLTVGDLPRDARNAQVALNDAVLEALGWSPTRGEPAEFIAGAGTVAVPSAHRRETATGTLLLALDTVFATDPAAVVAGKTAPAGRLLDPVLVNGAPAAHTAVEAAQLIFAADSPPSYLLFVSGGALTLLDRARWGEGVSLGVNLDDALARRDDAKKGELAAIAALFGAEAIDPGSDAQSVLARLLERAQNESAGVSKELRHGVRRSVEILANAVVRDMRYRQKGAWLAIDPRELTRQSLRYLYRIIVLLFAEARPELGILPGDDPDYQSGYSMARLRDTALVELHGEHARHARHLQRSLDVLFRLVNDGHAAELAIGTQDVRELTFPGLRSALFTPQACPLVDSAHLGDEVLQQVIANLCFTRPRAGRERETLSYATLGINQLGAVYEGLMAYSGFLATEPLFEVDRDGDPDNGSWLVPEHRADEFPDEVFLTEEGPDGTPRRVRYAEGDFVFRLAGRDRQRSASYYTPEVLTEFTVRHALDVLFEENPGMRAADILALTVCEPALGSGAFLNEAITQLAERYLKAAQNEAGSTIDPDRYQLELQRAKAHFAVNQAYGVDLNRTAVELAEVSLWLNCMHQGLRAPWFGARLRCGNSLIGARRATYSVAQVRAAAWAGSGAAPPTGRPLRETPLGAADGVHHFLLPSEGWGAACAARETRELDRPWADAVNAWRRAMRRKPTKAQAQRVECLAKRVEALWVDSAREVEAFWAATRQHMDVWGIETPPTGARFGQPAIREVLENPQSATCRLRTLMDAWCSLWLWGPEHGTALPSLDGWLAAAEALLSIDEPLDSDTLFAAEGDVVLPASSSLDEIVAAHPWLAHCRAIAAAQNWFHWELEFAPVFLSGGFDVQVGNPPWVRPEWSDANAVAEHDPLVLIQEQTPAHRESLRARALAADGARRQYLADRAEHAGLASHIRSNGNFEILAGLGTNLYLAFMVKAFDHAHEMSVIGLLHPDGHLTDPEGERLREEVYKRYRRNFAFVNELLLFAEIGDTRPFGVNIYGAPKARPAFLQASFVYHPKVVDQSLLHSGGGDLPGMQHIEGGWDVRPHRERLISVDGDVLKSWARLLGSEGAPRMIRTVTAREQHLVERLSAPPRRFGDVLKAWIPGLPEQQSTADGLLDRGLAVPDAWSELVVQGPHIGNLNPLYQSAEGLRHNDFRAVDLRAALGPDGILPTGTFRVLRGGAVRQRLEYAESGAKYRLIARKMIPANTWRSLFAAIYPAETPYVSVCYAGVFKSDRALLIGAAILNSLIADYFARLVGAGALVKDIVNRLPFLDEVDGIAEEIGARVLRMNCVTDAFADLWNRNSDLVDGRPWSVAEVLISDGERWSCAVEIDALVALALGVTTDQVSAAYRARFPVLRKYEAQTVFDASGHRVAGFHRQFGFVQAELEREGANVRGWRTVWDRVQNHLAGDTDVDLDPFVPPFRPADRVAAMTHAYWTFVDRYGLTPPDLAERPA